MVEEAAAAAQSMQEQAQILRDVVNVFRLQGEAV
jgi:methyl-accepting chemotaxis protein